MLTWMNDSEAVALGPDQICDCHHSVAQILFVSTQVTRDIQTAVAFLITRVKRPNEDYGGKLKHVLKYLKGMRHMRLQLGVDNLGIIQWWGRGIVQCIRGLQWSDWSYDVAWARRTNQFFKKAETKCTEFMCRRINGY
eukprot:CCRYP_019119-RA/>CCRYP_019119-RA protein AED:0.36 eAED:0.33 QI:0/0/0/1/0/0/2/0/137